MTISELLTTAIEKRQAMFLPENVSKTNCFRVFHGTVEGINGLTIDRYGDTWLVQSFHQTVEEDILTEISNVLSKKIPSPIVYNDRSKRHSRVLNSLGSNLNDSAETAQTIHENGLLFTSKLRHEGQDPWLFLDMRIGREFVGAHSKHKSVLNLFSYTCGIGIAAAVGGAERVVNVDFSSFALAAGKENAQLNDVVKQCEFVQSDVFPAIRQLAGLKVMGRGNKKLPDYPKLSATQFDLVFLDPPRFAKSPFGTVDLINDYQSLFKPAMLATKKGGMIVCCNNVAKVERKSWFSSLVRCVEKQGRSVSAHTWLTPHDDFPSFDDNHPLKIVALKIT
ncbi:class I SAM-dependent rRNA methyltransferase [Shewanella surugensis]|uniref:Class I SAM-dependent methyltransferase n=1 Tax=Shewanella surugensis TaxID=212020 RepID=A0ABT0LDS3_9GAMM|nr:class I SAM-dependent methyltransferase [Shewanella surugensis]MCL1125851.1 class I SAM-dependent methyltransferase [Shewanella surugensis]